MNNQFPYAIDGVCVMRLRIHDSAGSVTVKFRVKAVLRADTSNWIAPDGSSEF